MLELSDVTVRMGGQTIVDGVTLSVPASSIVAVLGANGAGKTSLMRAVSGIYPILSGTVRLLGQEITNEPAHVVVRRGLAQAPEGRQIFSTMTVQENLLLGSGDCGRSEARDLLGSMAERFPVLGQKMRHLAGSLSGGEQQMLCIARALMSRPKILLMDEPSLGLAPKVVRQIFDLIRSVRVAGTAVLLVEQNAAAALDVADTGYVLEGGRVVHSGASAALRGDSAVQAAYLGGVPAQDSAG